VNAFCPHGQRIGAEIGANADTDLYRCGLRSAQTSAPWPPIEWPKIPCVFAIAGKFSLISDGSSLVT
jgi:hypothetical protein